MVEAANTMMVPCQPATARMHSNPACRRLDIDAQIIEPARAPAPKDEISRPNLYRVSVESLLKGDQRVAEGRAAYIADIEQIAGGAVADLTEQELRRIRDQVWFMVQQARRERQPEGEET